jgi:mRNA (2'-O-methyladenosine-N6-)-methyltransferase
MADEQFRSLVSDTLYSLFSSSKVHTPIGSLELLSTSIATDLGSTPGDSTTLPKARFRLTDRSRFECAIEALAKHWERGSISITRDESGVTVTDVHLGSSSSAETTARVIGKRKRVKDEDADSAAGSGDEAEDAYEEDTPKPCTTLAILPKELKEVYAFLQRSTAKGRLLAEQVCVRMPDSLRSVYLIYSQVSFRQTLI